MKCRLWLALGVAIYGAMATLTYGAMSASDEWFCHEAVPNVCDVHMVRRDQFKAIAFALFPPAWISALLVTAGYQDGFRFTRTPAVTRESHR